MTAPNNDRTDRERHWRRFAGDPWIAFDSLPGAIRARLSQHAYDPWSVNASMLWRRMLRLHGSPARAERAMLRALDRCERLERALFADSYGARHGAALPHDAADASVLRAAPAVRRR